jgi:ribosomal protein L7Ae-like RNA K-turn-binding protein
MASSRNRYSASAGLPSADYPSEDSATTIERLSEDLSVQQAVLASLRDLPESSGIKKEIAAVKAIIADIARQLTEAQGQGTVSPVIGCRSLLLLI